MFIVYCLLFISCMVFQLIYYDKYHYYYGYFSTTNISLYINPSLLVIWNFKQVITNSRTTDFRWGSVLLIFLVFCVVFVLVVDLFLMFYFGSLEFLGFKHFGSSRTFCTIICLYVLSSVLWYPLRFPHSYDVRYVFAPSCLKEGWCLMLFVFVSA